MKLVILDWDGTLVDSLGLHFDSYKMVAEKFDIDVDIEEVRGMTGMTAPEIILEAYDIKDKEKIKSILKAKDEIYMNELWKEVKPFPGAQELIEELKDKFILAIATSSDLMLVRPVLEKFGWQYSFIEILGRDDVEKGKPEPEILNRICERTGIQPEEAVYVGDSVHDMMAAKKAEMMAIGVPTGVHSEEQLDAAGSDKVFENLFEVKDFLSGL